MPDSESDTDPENGPERARCSAKGCRSRAQWALYWANPKIHTGGREKTWVACDLHRESLGSFLGVRGFLHRVTPLDETQSP